MKIFREIVHYIGVAVKLPFLVIWLLSSVALFVLQCVSCVVRGAFDEPDIWNPITRLAEPLRDLADCCEVTPE